MGVQREGLAALEKGRHQAASRAGGRLHGKELGVSRTHSGFHQMFAGRTQRKAGKVCWQEVLIQPMEPILGSLAATGPGPRVSLESCSSQLERRRQSLALLLCLGALCFLLSPDPSPYPSSEVWGDPQVSSWHLYQPRV